VKAKKNNIEQAFVEGLSEKKLIQTGDFCLIAVSGGVDSVVMLNLFLAARESLQLKLGVIHVNHNLRGAESDADQVFVEDLAKANEITFFSKSVDVPVFAKERKLSIEEAARSMRYSFFEQTLAASEYQYVATGHTKNDQAETLFDRFMSGAGAKGLAGVPLKRGCYIRPLIGFTRTEIQSYAAVKKLSCREDSSNQDIRFRRNRIRHELLPYVLQNFNADIIETLSRSAEIFRETEEFLKYVAAEACNSLISGSNPNEIILDIEGFLGYYPLIRKYILFHCCSQLSQDFQTFNLRRLDRALKMISDRKPGKRIYLSSNLVLMIDHDGLVVGNFNTKSMPRVEISLTGSNHVRYHSYLFTWNVVERVDVSIFNQGEDTAFFDFDSIGGKVVISAVQSAESFFPINFGKSKKISDYFADRKVPLRKRQLIPVIRIDDKVVWVCGYRMDDRFKVTKKTKKILQMNIKQLK